MRNAIWVQEMQTKRGGSGEFKKGSGSVNSYEEMHNRASETIYVTTRDLNTHRRVSGESQKVLTPLKSIAKGIESL